MNYYSQHGEDRYIIDNFFKNKTGGTFVELGAIDGLTFSNTYTLEKYFNWSGVLIEPSIELFDSLVSNRPKSKCYNYAISTKKGEVQFDVYDHPAMTQVSEMRSPESTGVIQKTVLYPTIPICEILHDAEIKHIDFFSIDVEGAELDVLESMDWDISVDVMLLEIKNKVSSSAEKNIKCRDFLLSKGFIHHSDTLCDEVWIDPNFEGCN